MSDEKRPFPMPIWVSAISGGLAILLILTTLYVYWNDPIFGGSFGVMAIGYLMRVVVIAVLASLAISLLLIQRYGSFGARTIQLGLLFLLPSTLIFSVVPIKSLIKQGLMVQHRYEVELRVSNESGLGTPSPKEIEMLRTIFESRLAESHGRLVTWSEVGGGKVRMEVKGSLSEERLSSLLESHKTEFLETTEFNEGWKRLEIINQSLADSLRLANPRLFADTLVPEPEVVDYLHPRPEEDSPETQEEKYARFRRENPLLGLVTIPNVSTINPMHPLMGYVMEEDTLQFLQLLRRTKSIALMGRAVGFYLSAHPSELFEEDAGRYYDLVAVRPPGPRYASIDNSYVVDARQDFDGGQPVVSIRFNEEGSQDWKRMTRNNIGHCIAIVMDRKVLSYPSVQGEIMGGNSQITGNFTVEEARYLAMKIKAGQLPLDCTILRMEKLD